MDPQYDGLPPTPPMRRRLSFGVPQIVGIPLLLVLPVLALFRVFGTETSAATVSAPGLEATIRYPARFRFKTSQPLEIDVRNTGPDALPLVTVTVTVDRAWLSAFAQVRFTPQPAQVNERGYVVELHDIPPRGQRSVMGSIQAEHYGRHEGTIDIATEAGARLAARLSTVVLP